MINRTISLMPLIMVCSFSLLLIIPIINNNIDDPNRIVYFNADEGGQMDIIWSYYTGERRKSCQWDFDYGLEMLYLSDIAHIILSRFIDFTPGIFVLILRWLHLIFWVCALIALWLLVGRHFGEGWQQLLAVLLLAVRPAFAYFSVNLKPEPLVLFFMIKGLDYTLRLIEVHPWRHLFLAVMCAVAAFIVKFAGLFLLPAIAASMYLAERYQGANNNRRVFLRIKIAWIFPLLVGIIIIILPLILFYFYVRKSTGLTWYEQYGFIESLLQNRTGLYSCLVGLFLISFAIVLFTLNRNNNMLLKKIIGWINEINSHLLVVSCVFFGFILLFGFRWIITPKYFISTYAQLVPIASNTSPNANNIITRIEALDPIIVLLFIFYLFIEVCYRNQNLKCSRLKLFKRLILIIFLIPSFIFMLTAFKMKQHHMLPFFTAMTILGIQGINIFHSCFKGKRFYKNVSIVLISILLIADISFNGAYVVRSRIYQFNQHEDVSYEVAEWLRENVPENISIVSDHHTRVYIPPEYKNINNLEWNQEGNPEFISDLVNIYHPELVYYNENKYTSMPHIKEILPDKTVELVKSFESDGKAYKRRYGDKFVFYKIIY